jgi:hypothetical protein
MCYDPRDSLVLEGHARLRSIALDDACGTGAFWLSLSCTRHVTSPRIGKQHSRPQMKLSHLLALGVAFTALFCVSTSNAGFSFTTGAPDGRIAVASRPTNSGLGQIEIEAADDFAVTSEVLISNASFTGLLPAGAPLSSIQQVDVEIYRVFPLDSANPPSGRVPTRVNSPSDVDFDARSTASGGLSYTAMVVASSFTAANSVVNGINPSPNQTTGGEGAVSGEEVQVNVTLNPPFQLAPGHYFFIPKVGLSSGNFLWLSAAGPIQAGDLQAWIRNANLDPDWLRVGTDIVGGTVPPKFNTSFSLTGTTLTPTPTPTPIPTPTPTPNPTVLANISTRLRVETGGNVLIGGFIITGTQPKKVIVRAIGPSLPLAGALADPVLELHGPGAFATITNDNWRSDQQAEIIATGIPPTNDLESAIVATLPANSSAYTAIVRGVNNGTGIGLVEAYDLDRTVDSKLANISTRGLVQTGDNVLIAGTIVLGQTSQNVIVRAIGPSLNLPGKLADPILELRDGNGGLIRSNDNWRSDQEAEIIATGIPPTNDLESAIVATLPASGASYTAIVRGVNGTTGVAVVEVYALN